MVEKRTLAIIILATLTWALIATGSTTYYYLEQARYQEQLNEKQNLLNEITENYDNHVTKRNLLSSKYGELLGTYQFFVSKNWFDGENRSLCLNQYKILLSSLGSNYSSVFEKFPEINITYYNLLNETQTLNESQITMEKFDSLLNSFYKLFSTLTTKELENTISETSKIHVSLCINYTKIAGQLTIEWHNLSIFLGATLFDLTREVANVTYDYYATMEPGHILITSINNNTAWWIWSYWDETTNGWSWGPVGCDAWNLKNNGIYKWDVFP